jgi:drug/metabolite transporter (DMT)-like permease
LDARYPHALRGIGLMVLAVSTFACMDTMAKVLAAHYPVPAIVWARYFFNLAAMLVVLGPRLRMRLVRTTNLRLQLIRGGILTVSTLVFFAALQRMPIAEASSISFMSPLFIAVLAGPLLHERVDWRMWLALAAGFGGVLLIVRPGSAVFTWYALLPLGSALMMALYQIMTRKLAGRDSGITTLFYPALVGSIVVPLVFPLAVTFPDDPLHGGMFVALGVMGGIGHYFLIRAYDYAPATLLGPFVYAQLLSVLLLGWVAFGQLPDGLGLVGMVTITASGVLLILSYRRAGRRR